MRKTKLRAEAKPLGQIPGLDRQTLVIAVDAHAHAHGTEQGLGNHKNDKDASPDATIGFQIT